MQPFDHRCTHGEQEILVSSGTEACGKSGYHGLSELYPSDGQSRSAVLSNQQLPALLWLTLSLQIACGSNHTMALTDNGALWSWGDGRFGQLGHGLARDCGVPTRVPRPHRSYMSWLIVACCGQDAQRLTQSSRLEQVRALEEVDVVVAVACGSDHTVAVLSNGQLYSWGMGWHGQLGHERVASTKPLGSRRPSSPVRSAARWAPPASQKAHAGQHTTGRVYRQPHETALNVRCDAADALPGVALSLSVP